MLQSLLSAKVLILLGAVSLVTFALGVWVGSMLGGESEEGAGGSGRNDRDDDRDEDRRKGPRTGKEVELYVGNLPYDTSEKDLEKTFGEFGAVASIRIISNRVSGKSKGFGFIEMADQRGATAAVEAMDGHEMKGRKLVVNEAKSRTRGR